MTDEDAIRLFVADGNPKEDWPNVDQCVRNHYEKLALGKLWLVRPYEGTEWKVTAEPPTDELRRWLEFKPLEASSLDARRPPPEPPQPLSQEEKPALHRVG